MSEIVLVSAEICHSEILWEWRNEPINRKMGINSEKSPGESMKIGSELFVAMMKGHNLSASNMFDKENNLKKPIRKEALERLGFCEKEIEKSVKILYEKKMGKVPDDDLTKKLSKGLVWWFIDEFELTKKQLKIIQD